MDGTEDKTKAPVTHRRFQNYRRGPWDQVSDSALDTEASHSIAESNLNLHPQADAQMDLWQDEVDDALGRIRGATSFEEVEEEVEKAEAARAQVEVWEAIGEEVVGDARSAVTRARGSNHEVIGTAETERLAAADAQRNGTEVRNGR